MTQQFIRVPSLTVNGTDIAQWGSGGERGLRIRFQTISHTTQSLGLANFIVSNASKATAALVQKEGTKIAFSCGYRGEAPSLLFSGEVTETQYGERENYTDPLLRIWAADGDTAYRSTFNTTLAAGSTPKDIVDQAVKAMSPNGISLGHVVGIDLTTPKFPRGYVLTGLVRDALREVALSKGASFNLNAGKLNIVGTGAAVPGGAVVLNSSTGMIGQPIQREDGIIVRCLINPAIVVDGNVQIAQSSIVQNQFSNASLQASDATKKSNLAEQGVNDGVYRVLRIVATGDTDGNDWDMELTCIGAYTGKLNVIQADSGLS